MLYLKLYWRHAYPVQLVAYSGRFTITEDHATSMFITFYAPHHLQPAASYAAPNNQTNRRKLSRAPTGIYQAVLLSHASSVCS